MTILIILVPIKVIKMPLQNNAKEKKKRKEKRKENKKKK